MLEIREDFRDFMLANGISQLQLQKMSDQEFEIALSTLLDVNSPRFFTNNSHQAENSLQTESASQANQFPIQNFDDNFCNGDLDEEEALRLAIEQSLDDQLIPPHLRQIPSARNEVGKNQRSNPQSRIVFNNLYENYSSSSHQQSHTNISTTPQQSLRKHQQSYLLSQKSDNEIPNFERKRKHQISDGIFKQELAHQPKVTKKYSSNRLIQSGQTSSKITSHQGLKQKMQLKPSIQKTFLNEAILDPTPEILHPSHQTFTDDEDFGDSFFSYEPPTFLENQQNLNDGGETDDQIETQQLNRHLRKNEMTESQVIRNIQNMEYVLAQEEAYQKELDEIRKIEAAELAEKQLKEQKEKEENELRRIISEIPAEPQKGTSIAIQLPDGRRVVRKFDENSIGLYVYAWVCEQTIKMGDLKLGLNSFNLVPTYGNNETVKKNKTLKEQGIAGRVFLAINVL
ncbi:hypothetical protein TRFO_14655 [Tritrichomonas foetus]|uniref:UBX domain-containing protein n=1 Tax=Tritrichomonas foetus TaxID=1144522 RepID=A0A1J4KUN0_9EUKA|nr:hypothetical protein TRFO_14655 [Tritrichomonas foetus]|eukprot:OHT14985.1 hypothetical protein TRFO_14655 [Tritrichomonas foetus]